MTIEGEGHGAARHRASQTYLPEKLSVTRVQREEVALASSCEQNTRSRGEHTALRVVVHLELPLLFPGLRFDGDDGPVAFLILAESRGVSVPAGREAAAAVPWPLLLRGARRVPDAGISFAFHPRGSSLGRNLGAILPRGNVEEPGTRTKRRGIPIRSTLNTGLDEGAFKTRLEVRVFNGPPFRRETDIPILFYKGLAQQEFSCRAV